MASSSRQMGWICSGLLGTGLLVAGRESCAQVPTTPEDFAQGGSQPLTLTIKLQTIFGTDLDPAPHKKGLVLDSTLGALGFAGQFRKVAPPGPWLHTQLGYEIFRWLMVFGEGELSFTDTSNAQDQTKNRAFPIFGFGGGVRVTVHVTERVGIFLQGHGGFLKADVTKNALGLLGYKDAESLGLYYGGRLGVEWYQLDRHLALGLTGGSRLAQGFKSTGPKSDTPLLWEGGGSIRYTF